MFEAIRIGTLGSETKIVVLPSRGAEAVDLAIRYERYLPDATYYCLTPFQKQWYPMPGGSGDQEKAKRGLKVAADLVEHYLNTLSWTGDINLVGFSAGAVVVLELSTRDNFYRTVVAHGGAIFNNVLKAELRLSHLTKICLSHSKDDPVFGWEERYLPMKKALQENSYDLTLNEKQTGGHSPSDGDIEWASKQIVSNYSTQ